MRANHREGNRGRRLRERRAVQLLSARSSNPRLGRDGLDRE